MEKTKIKKNTYIEAVGRRKTSVARVRLEEGPKMTFSVNEKELQVYFPTSDLQTIVKGPFGKTEGVIKYDVSVKVKGGGIHSQAEAIRHGIARALISLDEGLKTDLKKAGFLKRDPRMKERRKFGLKKARKAPQWSKR